MMIALYHETTKHAYEKILESGSIMTRWDIEHHRCFVPGSGFGGDGFPGLYLSVLYEGDSENFQSYLDNDDDIIIILPIDIIFMQKNWHFNLIDKNGSITSDTYYFNDKHNAPNTKTVAAKQEYHPGNEICFHDSLSTQLIHHVIHKKDIHQYAWPKEPIMCNTKMKEYIDSNVLPIIIGYSDAAYTGIKTYPMNEELTSRAYSELVYAALPNEYRNRFDFTSKSKADVDLWVQDNCIIERFLENKNDRELQNFDDFFISRKKIYSG